MTSVPALFRSMLHHQISSPDAPGPGRIHGTPGTGPAGDRTGAPRTAQPGMRHPDGGPRLGGRALRAARGGEMSWLWAIIVGLVLGVIARAILPGKQDIPLWLTAVFGILGSILGNAVATWIGVNDTKGIDWIRHLPQLIGAIAVVGVGDMVWQSIRGNRSGTRRT